MLQQTQVERVLGYYGRWLERWPDFRSLAEATPAEVIDAWAGLGYNRRALNLHRLAVAVVRDHGGVLPWTLPELQRLPGIGPYTAAAVLCFARDLNLPVVDTNIARVLARSLGGVASRRELTDGEVISLARDLLPRHSGRDHALALMDIGAVVCTAREPRCSDCPLRSRCAWLAAGQPKAPRQRNTVLPFEKTTRFARGRIIQALRESTSLAQAEIEERLPEEHRPNVGRHLASLARDGFLEQLPGERWGLVGRLRAG